MLSSMSLSMRPRIDDSKATRKYFQKYCPHAGVQPSYRFSCDLNFFFSAHLGAQLMQFRWGACCEGHMLRLVSFLFLYVVSFFIAAAPFFLTRHWSSDLKSSRLSPVCRCLPRHLASLCAPTNSFSLSLFLFFNSDAPHSTVHTTLETKPSLGVVDFYPEG